MDYLPGQKNGRCREVALVEVAVLLQLPLTLGPGFETKAYCKETTLTTHFKVGELRESGKIGLHIHIHVT